MKRYLITLAAVLAIVSPLSAQMITNNKVLSWSTSAGQDGTIKISAVNGQYFEAAQTNEKNKAAGTVKLYGALLDGGKKVVLINTGQWKEVWEGNVSANEISGNLVAGSSKYTFKITEPVVVKNVAFPAGEYQGVHRHWTDKVIFNANGTYKRASNNDPGTWTYDGKTLVLKWAKWQAETLVMTSSGNYSCPQYKFTLTAINSEGNVSAATNPFVNGTTLKWNTSAGQNGTILVTSVTGLKFTLDQKNVNNVAAGTTKLEGEVKNGQIYIYNRQWNETWVGTLANGKVTGKINNRYNFTIDMTAQAAVSDAAESTEPFVNGKTLNWNTSAGQTGTIKVTSVSGTKFTLDQINFNNRGAGTTKLDGEIKGNKVTIYNRQWNETWVGTYTNGKVTGKINNRYNFTITQ